MKLFFKSPPSGLEDDWSRRYFGLSRRIHQVVKSMQVPYEYSRVLVLVGLVLGGMIALETFIKAGWQSFEPNHEVLHSIGAKVVASVEGSKILDHIEGVSVVAATVVFLTKGRAEEEKRTRYTALSMLDIAGNRETSHARNSALEELTRNGENLEGYDAPRADLKKINLAKAILSGATLKEAQLQYAILSEASLDNTTLSMASLQHAKLQKANLFSAYLENANLEGSDLSQANLKGALLQNATLLMANLSGANLSDANLNDADLRDADLRDADLKNADLMGADLRGANLELTDFRGANLAGANFKSVQNLTRVQVTQAHNWWLGIYDNEFWDAIKLGHQEGYLLASESQAHSHSPEDKSKRQVSHYPPMVVDIYPVADSMFM